MIRWLMQFFLEFLTLEGYSAIFLFLGKSAIYVFKLGQYFCKFTSPDFRVIPGKFPYLPVENLLLRLTLENFWN